MLDLEAVVNRLQLDRFVLLARGPMGHAALRLRRCSPGAGRSPRAVFLPASGDAWPASFAKSLAAEDWDLFLQTFTAFDGRPLDPEAAVRRLRQTVTQEDWAHPHRNWIASDIRPLLQDVSTPALVIHPRDVMQPMPDASMAIAAGLPNASFLMTEGSNQLGDLIRVSGPSTVHGVTAGRSQGRFRPRRCGAREALNSRKRGPAPDRRGPKQSADRQGADDQPQHSPPPRLNILERRSANGPRPRPMHIVTG